MLVDTHLHLLESDFDDIDKVIRDAYDAQVKCLILGGCDKESNSYNIELSNKYNNVYSTLGFHPEFADVITSNDLVDLKNMKTLISIFNEMQKTNFKEI